MTVHPGGPPPTTEPEPHESGQPRRGLSPWWMVVPAFLVAVAGVLLWLTLDVLPESRWVREHDVFYAARTHGSRPATTSTGAPAIRPLMTVKPGTRMPGLVVPTTKIIGPEWLVRRLPMWYTQHMVRMHGATITGHSWKPEDLAPLAGFDGLYSLNLTWVNIEALPELPQVTELVLSRTPVAGLDRFPNVQSLTVSEPLNEASAEAVSRLKHLKRLDLPGLTPMDERLIDSLKTAIPGLVID